MDLAYIKNGTGHWVKVITTDESVPKFKRHVGFIIFEDFEKGTFITPVTGLYYGYDSFQPKNMTVPGRGKG